MATNKSNGNSDTVTESDEGDFDEIAFEQNLANSDPTLIESEEVPEDLSDEPEPEEDVDAEEAEDEPEEEDETEEAETDEEEDSDDVLSQIDFDALTDEQKQEIAKAVGSGAGKELGKLRGEIRELKESKDSLQQQLDEGLSKMLPTSNAHSEIHTTDELDRKQNEVEGSYRYLDDLLSGTEEYFEIQGKEVDRATAVSWKRYYEAQARDIPAQRKAIKALEGIQGLTNEEVEKAKAEVKFFEDEKSAEFKEWKSLTSDAEFSLMARAFPKLGAQLARALAHSVAFKSKKPVTKIKLPRNKAKPINGITGGDNSAKQNRGKKKQSDSMRKRFQSGEQTDEDILASMNIS
jgi:hypothetical protein